MIMEKDLQKIIDGLNKKYATSYTARFEHAKEYFRKKLNSDDDFTEHLKKVVIDKDVTLELCDLPNNVAGNARKTDNIIQLDWSLFDYKNIIGSGYKKEDGLIKQNVNNQKQYIKWVICHEYCHLLYPELGHTKEFFSLVEKLYNNNI